jgi:hypothetical protein
LLLDASRAERLEAAIQVYLAEFMAAIQRADTAALEALVPAAVVPDGEKPVASREGCPSLGRAVARLRDARANESPIAELPLHAVRSEAVVVDLVSAADTIGRVRGKLVERRGGRVRYAPIEIVFTQVGGTWAVALAKGTLVGLCGLATAE